MAKGVKPFVDVFTGAAGGTWTLPPVADTVGQIRFAANRGTALLAVQRAGSDQLFTDQATTQVYIPPGACRTFINDGTYWVVDGPLDGIVLGEQFITNNASPVRTLTSQTAAQAIWNAPANGEVILIPGTYFFEAFLSLSSMAGVSGSFGFELGTGFGGVIADQLWLATANKASNPASPSLASSSVNTAANTALVSANNVTKGWAHIRGKVRMSTGGGLIPQVSLGVAAAAVVDPNSYFRIWSAGLDTATSAGSWV